jgi:hypothetical protein
MPKGGAELVINFRSNEVSLFTYGGGTGSIGEGASGDIYVAAIFNLPNNAAYEGAFYSVDVTISRGPVGATGGYFGVPGDSPINPQQSYGVYAGWAPGVGVVTTNQLVYYSSLATYNASTDTLTIDYLNK